MKTHEIIDKTLQILAEDRSLNYKEQNFLDGANLSECQKYLQGSSVPEEELTIFWKHPDMMIKMLVVKHPNTSPITLNEILEVSDSQYLKNYAKANLENRIPEFEKEREELISEQFRFICDYRNKKSLKSYVELLKKGLISESQIGEILTLASLNLNQEHFNKLISYIQTSYSSEQLKGAFYHCTRQTLKQLSVFPDANQSFLLGLWEVAMGRKRDTHRWVILGNIQSNPEFPEDIIVKEWEEGNVRPAICYRPEVANKMILKETKLTIIRKVFDQDYKVSEDFKIPARIFNIILEKSKSIGLLNLALNHRDCPDDFKAAAILMGLK